MQELTGGPRAHLTEQQVLDVLRLEPGPQIRWGLDILNPTDMSVRGIHPNLLSVDIDWSYRALPSITGGTPDRALVRRTGSAEVMEIPGFAWHANYYRPWVELLGYSPTGGEIVDIPGFNLITDDGYFLVTEEEEEIVTEDQQIDLGFEYWVRFHQGVFVATNPPAVDTGTYIKRSLELAELVHIAQGQVLSDPLNMEAGTSVTEWLKSDLGIRLGVTDFSRIQDSEKVLEEPLFFDVDTTRLEIYNTLLEYIGYDYLHTDEEGRFVAQPLEAPTDREFEHEYRPGGTLVRESSIESINPELPNVIRFVALRGPSLAEEGNGIRTVVNQNDGPSSLSQLGRPVTLRVEVEARDQEELDLIARTQSQYYFAGGGYRFVGSIGINPRHADQDVVLLIKPGFGIAGNWIVTSWSLSSRTPTMSIEMEKVTGMAFVTSVDALDGAFGTVPFATRQFGEVT